MTQDLTKTEQKTEQNRALTPTEPGDLDLEKHPVFMYLVGLAPGSRRTMSGALNTIAKIATNGKHDALTMPWGQLRVQHTMAIRAALAERYAPATANKMLSALRKVLKASWSLGQMPFEDCQKAISIGRVKGDRLPAGRSLTPGEIGALFGACANDPTPAGARDAALLALLRLGLRRQEVAGLALDDYEPEPPAVKVRGKGNRDRLVPLMNGAARAVVDWLRVRGDEPGPLLQAVNRGGRILQGGLTAQAIYSALAKRATEAGVSDLTPHDWRRTFAGDLLDAGADLSTVQKLMGHSDPATTARYDRRDETAKRRAVGLLHVPYHGRGLDSDL